MPYSAHHLETAPDREDVDQRKGAAVLEFGTAWCGHCQRAQPLIEQALRDQAQIEHIKVEDGPGRPLGRSYKVKLWPTLIFLQDGQEVARAVRPQTAQELDDALAHLTA
ncbi:thioredoxin [Melaminivora suipulveris]|uniref:Thioredoxin n=1 Tax=Melaminivora suipulveris TaxID=2109913 RepID=A0A2R3Q8R2_9BURK|nr:thioredoxin family protein [Melaminivora suipulveris]AVO48064.1 thioredoxin [Melaminivora suipulveris]